MTWKKYEFTDAKWAEMKAKIQKTFPDIEGGELTEYDPEKVTAVVEIGKLCTEWGTNEEGFQVCTKQAAKLSVDILWTDKPLTGWATYTVNVAPGKEAHQFAGMQWGDE
jgi:hypothetical protein